MARRLLLVTVVLLVVPAASFADVINIGVLSFDVLIPNDGINPGTNVFTVQNLTGDPSIGGFALPPDFTVFDFLTFLDGFLTLFTPGSPDILVDLGPVGPG